MAPLLVAGSLCSLGALFCPWVEIDPDSYGLAEDFLSGIGVIPDSGLPIRGWNIPFAVRDAMGSAGIRTSESMKDLFAGRWDRSTARLLFGEQFEAKYAPLIFAPAALCLLATAFAFRRKHPMFAAWLLLVLICTLGLALYAVVALLLSNSPLRVLYGIPLTLFGGALSAYGLYLRARPT